MWNMLLNFNRNIEAHIFELSPFRGLSTVLDVYNHYYYCYITIIILIITIIILYLILPFATLMKEHGIMNTNILIHPSNF